MDPSCKRTVENVEVFVRERRVYVYASRDLKVGDEITLDYGGENFDRYIRPWAANVTVARSVKKEPRTFLRGLRRVILVPVPISLYSLSHLVEHRFYLRINFRAWALPVAAHNSQAARATTLITCRLLTHVLQ